MATGYSVEMPKPGQCRRHSVAAPPSSMAVIYGQPGGKSTRPLHFFDGPMTFLPLAPVDNPAAQPAKLLRNGRNSGNLSGSAAVKKFSPAPNAGDDRPLPRLRAGTRTASSTLMPHFSPIDFVEKAPG